MQVSRAEQIEVKLAGSSVFGRYPKINLEKTYNMFISDNWLVNYAGFRKFLTFQESGQGRGIFNSIRGEFLITIISSSVYRINADLNPIFIASIDTTMGAVSIDENLEHQICIVDGQDAYIYNYVTGSFTKQTLTFNGLPILPGYVCYHNTFFLIASAEGSDNSQNWYAFIRATDSTIVLNPVGGQFSLQTKPDSALIVKRIPGKGNNVLVLGSTVAEVWTNVGGTQNYQRVSSFNIDNGVLSVPTLAANEEFVCWLAQNENNSPFIMITDGASFKRISSDGIDYVLSLIEFPAQSTGFFFRQDGHLFYQITFFNPNDNLSLIYDFTTGLFFHVSNENLDYHPARQVAFFRGVIFFVSLNDSSLYLMDTNLITYNYSLDPDSVGQEIPRIRICNTIRKGDSDRFRVGQFTFWLEQGVTSANPPTAARVDMSFSKNGNESFSNVVSHQLNPIGQYRNQIRFWRLGQANEFTIQLRFYGFQRFVVNNGVCEVY